MGVGAEGWIGCRARQSGRGIRHRPSGLGLLFGVMTMVMIMVMTMVMPMVMKIVMTMDHYCYHYHYRVSCSRSDGRWIWE